MASGELQGGSVKLVVTVAVLIALWSSLPRAYELWPDRLRIVLGWRWGFNIPLDEIEEIQPARGVATLFASGAMFLTSVKTPVRVRRTKGMDITTSPDDPLEFIESTRRAMRAQLNVVTRSSSN